MLNGYKSIFYSSYHNYFDMSSGAAISVRAVLLALARDGWRVRVLCGPFFDNGERKFEEFLSYLTVRGITPKASTKRLIGRGKTIIFKSLDFYDGGIESSVVFIVNTKERKDVYKLSRDETDVFLFLYNEEFIERRPDVFMTYGGFKTVFLGAAFFKKRNVKTVFYLCNLAYHNRSLFNHFDSIVVPSYFAKDRYKERLGIETVVIPPLIEETVVASKRAPRYLTFINPSREKGLEFASFLFQELSERRSDIPVLMVQGRARIKDIAMNLGKISGNNVQIMRGIVTPRKYYQCTRLLFVPSICEETFGRIVIEAGMNRIPCVCSNRGALPDSLGNGGITLPIPNLDMSSKKVVERDVMESWIKAIVRYWDDERYYQEACENAFLNSLRFSEKKIETLTVRYFNNLN